MRTARAEFAGDLILVTRTLVSMTKTASLAIDAATTALVDCDADAATRTAVLRQQLTTDHVAVERRIYRLLARQQPVARDLRVLVAGVKISADCRRMAALASHIGAAAARCHPESAVPGELGGVFRRMGELASRIADGAAVTLDTSDAQDAARLEVDDDLMDDLGRDLFRRLITHWIHGVEAAVNVALISRYYERFSDHAVAIAQSVIFVIDGHQAPEPSTGIMQEKRNSEGSGSDQAT